MRACPRCFLDLAPFFPRVAVVNSGDGCREFPAGTPARRPQNARNADLPVRPDLRSDRKPAQKLASEPDPLGRTTAWARRDYSGTHIDQLGRFSQRHDYVLEVWLRGPDERYSPRGNIDARHLAKRLLRRNFPTDIRCYELIHRIGKPRSLATLARLSVAIQFVHNLGNLRVDLVVEHEPPPLGKGLMEGARPPTLPI